MKTRNKTAAIAARVEEIRMKLFGANGIDALAMEVGVPADTWRNYERGVTMPAHVLLKFLAVTGANPDWLLTGKGERSIAVSGCAARQRPGNTACFRFDNACMAPKRISLSFAKSPRD